MEIHFKKTLIGITCLAATACSTLEQYGLKDFSSIPTSVPSAEDVKGSLNSSRAEGAINLAKAATLSNEDAISYAKYFSKIKDGQNKLASNDNPYTIRLNKLVKNHLKEDGLNLNFKVYMSPEVNAFAMADGTIRVYSGIMDRMKDDELLFVLGHEIGHVKHQHSKDKLQKAYASHALLSTGANELSAATGNTVAGGLQRIGLDQAEDILEDLANAQFSQSDEKEADDYGLKFTRKHGYTSDAGVRALHKLASLNEKESSLVEGLFSSHPDSGERAQRLQEQLGLNADIISETNTNKEGTAKTEFPAHSENESSYGSLATAEENASEGLIPAVKASYTYQVQVEAAPNKEKADETLANFEASGFTGQIQEALVNGNVYFRVLIGKFASFAAAKSQLAEIANTGLSDGQPFIQKIELK